MQLPQNYLDVISTWKDENAQIGTRAEETIQFILKDIIDSKSSLKFNESSLTFTGSPFEPAFSFSTNDVRYTLAPAPKSVSGIQRLDHTLNILKALELEFKDETLLATLRKIQSKGKLSYGAQIGVRHSPNKDVYKLYIELPEEAKEVSETLVKQFLQSDPILKHAERNSFPTLMGINLDTSEKEFYYRVENLHPQEIKTILRRANSEDRFDDVINFLNETQELSIKHFLPGNTWGYSYSVDGSKNITCSIYTFAKTLFGPDGWVREKVLQLGAKKSWNINVYQKISKALENNRDTVHHGIFGIVLPKDRPAAAWVGISPIEQEYV